MFPTPEHERTRMTNRPWVCLWDLSYQKRKVLWKTRFDTKQSLRWGWGDDLLLKWTENLPTGIYIKRVERKETSRPKHIFFFHFSFERIFCKDLFHKRSPWHSDLVHTHTLILQLFSPPSLKGSLSRCSIKTFTMKGCAPYSVQEDVSWLHSKTLDEHWLWLEDAIEKVMLCCL